MPNDAITKNCPVCESDLPLSEFGRNKHMPGGRSLYCLACNRMKMAQHRKRKAEYQQNLLRAGHKPDLKLIPRPKVEDRVLTAITDGHRSFYEIKAAANVQSEDYLCLVIADLLLWKRKIKTYGDDENRRYYAA